MPIITILLVVALVIGLVLVSSYNKFVVTKTRIVASIQEIGNQLKRQADLIPNLEESAKAYLTHEKDIFTKLTSARMAVESAVKSSDVNKMSAASSKVSELLGGLKVILESNPEIKGSEVISNLMEELRDTADKVMYSRRTLIDLTADYNSMILAFPSNLIANLFGFKQQPGFDTPQSGDHLSASGSDLETPKVNLN